jgi:hypothetical protein
MIEYTTAPAATDHDWRHAAHVIVDDDLGAMVERRGPGLEGIFYRAVVCRPEGYPGRQPFRGSMGYGMAPGGTGAWRDYGTFVEGFGPTPNAAIESAIDALTVSPSL